MSDLYQVIGACNCHANDILIGEIVRSISEAGEKSYCGHCGAIYSESHMRVSSARGYGVYPKRWLRKLPDVDQKEVEELFEPAPREKVRVR